MKLKKYKNIKKKAIKKLKYLITFNRKKRIIMNLMILQKIRLQMNIYLKIIKNIYINN